MKLKPVPKGKDLIKTMFQEIADKQILSRSSIEIWFTKKKIGTKGSPLASSGMPLSYGTVSRV